MAFPTPGASATQPSFTGFLKLPPELRDHILSYVVARSATGPDDTNPSSVEKTLTHPVTQYNKPSTPGIFRASRQMHAEATQAFNRQTLNIHITRDFSNLESVTEGRLPPGGMRHLHVHVYLVPNKREHYKCGERPSKDTHRAVRRVVEWLNSGYGKGAVLPQIETLRVSLHGSWEKYSGPRRGWILDEFKALRPRRLMAGVIFGVDFETEAEASTDDEPASLSLASFIERNDLLGFAPVYDPSLDVDWVVEYLETLVCRPLGPVRYAAGTNGRRII